MTGRLYLLSVGAGAVGGFIMAWLSWGGWAAHASFALWALVWSGASLDAYFRAGPTISARKGNGWCAPTRSPLAQ